MINLAGNKDCDKTIREELTLAGIPIIELNSVMDSEVPASVIGHLNGFTFKRGWYYWMVSGYMPLLYANEMYRDYKHLVIRAAGHCMDPPPSEWCEPKDYRDKISPILNLYWDGKISSDECNRRCKKIKRQGDQFVTSYHIDSQEGLNVFCRMVKEHNITG